MLLKNFAIGLCAIFVLAMPTFAGSTASGSGRKLYKWVDEQGVNHYGDHIPPEYAAQEQHIINAEGVETEHIEAQKSPEQMAAEEQKKHDIEERANRDRNLLTTYVSVAEIERLRDQRLALLADQVKVTGQFLDVLNGRMKKLRVSSMTYKPYNADPNAPRMTDQLAEDLVRVGTDIHTQEENLREKRNEQTIMGKQFEDDITRFKQLRGIH